MDVPFARSHNANTVYLMLMRGIYVASRVIFMDRPRMRTVRGAMRLTAHVVSDTSLAELHAFATSLGIPARGFHDKPGQPHYDLIEPYFDKAEAAGALLVPNREIILALRRLHEREQPLTSAQSPDAGSKSD
jgi:hypothetical protein